MPCIVFPDNSITRKTTFQTNIIGAHTGVYENYDFLKKKTLNISFRTGQLFLCDNSFEKQGTEKNTLGI